MLHQRIGVGGMAQVWRAVDLRLGRAVAVKLLRDPAPDPEDRARFAAEARTLAALSHPHLVTVLDAGTEGDQPFLVLELVDGPTLGQRLRTEDLSPDEVARIGAEVAAALAHIHAAGIVHRDVKPANILLDASGSARLTDFGIARLVGDTTRFTRTGATIGSPAYLAPEQVRGEPLTPAVDVYALGLVVLEAVTGGRAFPGAPAEAAVARLTGPPALLASAPPSWQGLLAAMTSLDPADRPSAADVAGALADGGSPVVPAPDATRLLTPVASPAAAPVAGTATVAAGRARRRPALVAVGLAAAACVVGLGTAVVLSTGDDPAASAQTPTTPSASASVTRTATPTARAVVRRQAPARTTATAARRTPHRVHHHVKPQHHKAAGKGHGKRNKGKGKH